LLAQEKEGGLVLYRVFGMLGEPRDPVEIWLQARLSLR
jgi:hypothetical protein